MIQSQSQQRHICGLAGRNVLLQQHPVLLPLLLLSGSVLLYSASLFADSLFPVVTLIGLSPTELCLSLAAVVGVAGVLTSIIGIIERLNHYGLQATMFFRSQRSRSYDRN